MPHVAAFGWELRNEWELASSLDNIGRWSTQFFISRQLKEIEPVGQSASINSPTRSFVAD